MNIGEKSFTELFPEKDLPDIDIKFSRKFSSYNGNVRKRWNHIQLNLSEKWRNIDENITMGLIQNLFLKLYKEKRHTLNMDLYESFVKNLHHSVAKTKTDPLLEESFNRVNAKYFNGSVETTNLQWKSYSVSTLGTYNYHTDTISISEVFKEAPKIFLDYVMHHEILHKKIKFKHKNGRSFHHTSTFRKNEREFENQKIVEKELRNFLRRNRKENKPKPVRKGWWFW